MKSKIQNKNLKSKLQTSKLNMRPLTNKEKLLLALLGIVLVVYLSNSFILTPQADKLDQLETEKTELDNRIIDMNNTLKREKDIRKEWEILHRERNEILRNYFPVLDQSQIIYLLNDLLLDERVDISDLSFNEPNKETIGEMDVKNMNISVPFKGTYDGIVSIIESIGSSPRRILIDSLSMDRGDDGQLSGSMSLKVYSLEGIAEADPNVIYVETVDSSGDESLFGSFDGYIDTEGTESEQDGGETLPDSLAIDTGPGVSSGSGSSSGPGSGLSVDNLSSGKVYLLHDFETRNYSFIPANKYIKGNAVPSTISKSGKYSLRFEYNMLSMGEKNKSYIDLGSEIELKYPPETISMWINSFGYSPGSIGMAFRTQTGEDIEISATEGISWLGWSKIGATPPQELDKYPLKLTHLYFELPSQSDDFGVFLIDKLEANYPKDWDAGEGPLYDFYVVKHGDSITNISKEVYGTADYKNEIMKNNNINPGETLAVGKVLVLVRR